MSILVTKRLTLRRPVWIDAEDIAANLSDWNVARMLATVPFPYFTADAEDWIAGLAAEPDALVYTIHREKLIGVVSLEGDPEEPTLGYWLARPFHGHGYTTEAVAAVLTHAFAMRPLKGVNSSVFADNPASLRVQDKLGFRVTGAKRVFSRPRDATVETVTTRLAADTSGAARRTEPMAA